MDWVVVFNSSFLAYYFYSNQWREWKNNMQTNQEKKESERLGWGAETVWDTILYVWFHQSLMRVMEFRLLDYNFSLTAEISLRASCSKCQSTSARTWNSMDKSEWPCSVNVWNIYFSLSQSFPQCFYIPKCQENKTEQESEASNIKHVLSAQGENMTCYLSATYPDDAILRRKYTIQMAFYYLLWPSLVLFGGILLVGLVKLSQHLTSLCTEISREELLGKQSKLTEGRIYRFLRCRPGGNMEQHDQVS